MSASAAPSTKLLPVPVPRPSAPSAMKLGLRLPPARPSTPRIDEFAGLERLDREELDEDYVPPSRRRVA